jgi:hypothetical protein
MRVQHAAVVEQDELMFPSPFDVANNGIRQGSPLARAQSARQGRVQRANTLDALAGDRTAQFTNGSLNFGKLRHLMGCSLEDRSSRKDERRLLARDERDSPNRSGSLSDRGLT